MPIMDRMILALTPGMAELPPESRDAFVACAIVLVVILAMGSAVLWIKRRFRPGGDSVEQAALSIDQVERLHQAGHLTREEFETLRRIALKLAVPDGKSGKSSLTPRAEVDDDNDEDMARKDPAPAGPEGV